MSFLPAYQWLLRYVLFCLIGALLQVATVHAAVPTCSGFLKSLNLYGEAAPADQFPHYQLSSNRLRLDLTWDTSPDWQAELSADHQFLWSNPGRAFALSGDGYNRHLDFDKSWQHSSVWSSRLQIDRLNLRWRSNRFDAVIGRQAIGFGRIALFSPLDIIAPFAPDALDTDVRSGVDALHLTYNYGLDGQLGGVFVWGKEEHYNSYLLTWVDNQSGVDYLAIGGSLRDRPVFGFGMAGNLGTLGLKGELALYQGQRTDRAGEDLHDEFLIGALEAWYRFDMGLTLISQYLYNGPGSNSPGGYDEVSTSAPLREGLTYLLGRHYLLLAPSYQLHPLASINGLLIWNLQDDSFLIRPALELSLADNASLEFFWTSPQGASPKRTDPALPPLARSEFGLRGNSGGFFLKLFF